MIDLQSLKEAVSENLSDLSTKMQRNNFKTDVKRRLRYYQLLRDYINSPGSTTAEAFFSWYPEQLDKRAEAGPVIAKTFRRITKSKSDASFRVFLADGALRHESGEGLTSILQDWIPDDELRVLLASSSSDITNSLDVLIDICQDKINNAKQITDAISSNTPLILIAFLLHWILYSMLYTSFVSPSIVEDTRPFSEFSLLEQRYIQYHWISQIQNALLASGILVIILLFFNWSVKNWSERGVRLREEFFDFLPPYSLSKINQQYQVLMVVNNFFEAGSSFSEALTQAKKGSSPYVSYQIDKILANSSTKANEAINTLFFGELGSIIRERGEHVPLQQAIKALVPTMRAMKKEKFDRAIKWSTLITIKPIIYLSFAYAIFPIVMYFVEIMTTMQDQLN